MDEAPLVEGEDSSAQKNAAAFTQMAERIMLNKDGYFGGAVVIIPPENGGEPVDFFLLSKQSPVMFWASLKAIVQAEIDNLDAAARQRPYGR